MTIRYYRPEGHPDGCRVLERDRGGFVYKKIKTSVGKSFGCLIIFVGYSFGYPSGKPGLPTWSLYHIYFFISTIFSKFPSSLIKRTFLMVDRFFISKSTAFSILS